MLRISDIEALRAYINEKKRSGFQIGFVPTMGFLHEGHISLVKSAAARPDSCVVSSIFVNPLQFNDRRDFEAYPVDLEGDCAKLSAAGASAVFLPSMDQLYPARHQTRVSVSKLTAMMEGEFRPGHFEGVTTVVNILFNLVTPDFAVFGEKDFQQLRVIEQMVGDLKMPIEIIRGATVRESDGLAMSSRNVRLNSVARSAAAFINQGLFQALDAYRQGERSAEKLEEIAHEKMRLTPQIEIEYITVADSQSLTRLSSIESPSRIFVAARIDGVRLIDNLALTS